MTTELTREALGADADGEAATVDVRGYLPVWPRHAVLAARAAGAAAWGDGRARRVFSASGNGPHVLAFDFGSDAVGLLRGLDEDEIAGTRAAVVNLDYRFPLARIDRGLGTLPAFARVVHGAVFVDAGHAWVERFNALRHHRLGRRRTLARCRRRLRPAPDVHRRRRLGVAGPRLRRVRAGSGARSSRGQVAVNRRIRRERNSAELARNSRFTA